MGSTSTGVSWRSPVATSTMNFANWLASRGRLASYVMVGCLSWLKVVVYVSHAPIIGGDED